MTVMEVLQRNREKDAKLAKMERAKYPPVRYRPIACFIHFLFGT